MAEDAAVVLVHPPVLTPLTWLARAELVFADRAAVVDGADRYTWAQFAGHCRRGAGVLVALGIRPGSRVGVLAPNSLMLYESQFAIPAAGGVIVNLNPRLSAAEVGYILEHAQVDVLLVDDASVDLAESAISAGTRRPTLLTAGGPNGYLARRVQAQPTWCEPDDELAPIAINYTSGTTGQPKGAIVTHRGVFLQALAMVVHMRLESDSTYLWTLPIFHANGWCFAWALAAVGCPSVLLPRPDPAAIRGAIARYPISHLCAAPTVLNGLLADPAAVPPSRITVAIGGSPPSPTLIGRIRAVDWRVIHLYGLTETSGPSVICLPQPGWEEADDVELSGRLARQGVPNIVTGRVAVFGPETGPLPPGDPRMGEIRITGQTVFGGYHRDPAATAAVFADGWFRTGDVGVMHTDGYVELLDRDKDIIICGGENIASVEIERVLDAHPSVLESAVVAAPDPRWGEVPVAVVTLRPGAIADEAELIAFVKSRIARFKAPHRVVFGTLQKGETGKVHKHLIRAEFWQGIKRRIQ